MKIGLMSLRNAFALAPASFVLSIVGTPGRALAADSVKEVCLSSADLGQSLRDDGKYSSARDQFTTCERDVCPKLVHDQCAEWLHQIDEAMPTVLFGVKDDHGTDVAGARVLADGKLVAASYDGKPVPLDPGAHDVRFERDAPTQSVSTHILLRTGEKNREVTAAFPAIEAGPPGPEPEVPGAPPAPTAPEASSGFRDGRAITSLTLLGGGVVGVGLGVFFGLTSQNERSEAATLRGQVGTSGCPTPSTSDTCQQLSDKVDAQNRDAIVSDVLYVTGGVLAVGALTAWLLWPKAREEGHANAAKATWIAPVLGPGSAGVRVGGAF